MEETRAETEDFQPEDEHTYEEQLTCPYCGYEDTEEQSKWSDDVEVIEVLWCFACGRAFEAHRWVEVYFKSVKIPDDGSRAAPLKGE